MSASPMPAPGSQPAWFMEMLGRLPSAAPREVLRNESDFYGAADLVATALRLTETPLSRAVWTHGWVYFPCPFIESFVWSCGMGERRVLTQREEQAEFLRARGVAAIAAGAPILYVEEKYRLPSLPRSLLIMPTHSLDETRHVPDEAAYFEQLDPVLSSFDYAAACLHPSCLDKNLWVENLRRRQIPWFSGANVRDRNALRRMVTAFSSFTHVTSNGVGSHLPYAAYYGCRVSIYGPMPAFRASDLAEQPFYKQNPHILTHNCELVESGYLQDKFARFFCSPQNARADREWAAKELGADVKRTAGELAGLLGWRSPVDLDDPGFTERALIMGWETSDPEMASLREVVRDHALARENQRVQVERLKLDKQNLRKKNEMLRQRVQRAEIAARAARNPPAGTPGVFEKLRRLALRWRGHG